MTNLTIKDLEHFESVIKTIKTYDFQPVDLYCSQEFYDNLLNQCNKYKSENQQNFMPAVEIYINSKIPENCAILQGINDTYFLKYV